MNTYPHDIHRLSHYGLRGISEYDRRRRNRERVRLALWTLAFIGVLLIARYAP